MAKKHEANHKILWNNVYPYRLVSIFTGKKMKHDMNLLGGLELNGPSTTKTLAKFVLTYDLTSGQKSELHQKEFSKLAHAYWKSINIGVKKIEHKKKVGRYPSLLEEEFIHVIGNTKSEKNIDMSIYFPTLKGHLVALGYVFNDNELKIFITNAARNSLYFAYLKSIMQNIGLVFLKNLFILPIKEMIENQRIRFDDDYRVNFDLIASATVLKINKIIDSSWAEIYSYDVKTDSHLIFSDKKLQKQLDQLMNLTWFELGATTKWIDKMIDLYYTSDAEKEFYSFRSDFSDPNLLYKVMREIHHAYYYKYRIKVPPKYQQKFPVPISRNRKNF